MLLVIDAGNTNVVFAVHDGTEWRGRWRIATSSQRTSDEYAVWLVTLLAMAGLDRSEVSRAVLGTVVPAALYHLRQLCRKWFDVEPLIARSGLHWGFQIKLERPEEVGADRLANALAGHSLVGGPLIVVDFGTATNFDVVDAQGAFIGGAIAPGINLSIEALHQNAARLPRIGISRPPSVIGTGTVGAMQSGVYWGYIGLIEGVCARIKAEYGAPMRVIATGGLAPLFTEGSALIERDWPDLTLDGLRMLAERNPIPKLSPHRVRSSDAD